MLILSPLYENRGEKPTPRLMPSKNLPAPHQPDTDCCTEFLHMPRGEMAPHGCHLSKSSSICQSGVQWRGAGVSLAKVSYSVLRLTPKVRQTADLLMPCVIASRIASLVSARMACGRPPRLPRLLAASSPAKMRSVVSARSYWARDPNTWKRNSPCGVVVSICSVSDRNATPRA